LPDPSAHREKGRRLDGLSPYDRVTVAMWRTSYAALRDAGQGRHRPAGSVPACLTQAAVHAVLVGLRSCAHPPALFARHEADPTGDFVLIASLLGLDPDGPTAHLYALLRVRDAAFWVRWEELVAPSGRQRDSQDSGDGELPAP
jgi:hypothetical protein